MTTFEHAALLVLCAMTLVNAGLDVIGFFLERRRKRLVAELRELESRMEAYSAGRE